MDPTEPGLAARGVMRSSANPTSGLNLPQLGYLVVGYFENANQDMFPAAIRLMPTTALKLPA